MNTVHTVWTGPGWYASRERGNEIEETVYFRRWDVGEVDASKINNFVLDQKLRLIQRPLWWIPRPTENSPVWVESPSCGVRWRICNERDLIEAITYYYTEINNIMEGNDWSELIAHVRRLGELSELRGRWCWHDCA